MLISEIRVIKRIKTLISDFIAIYSFRKLLVSFLWWFKDIFDLININQKMEPSVE